MLQMLLYRPNDYVSSTVLIHVFLQTNLKSSQGFILNLFFELDNMPIW